MFSRPFRPIQTLTSPPSLSNVHTAAVASPALTVVGRASSGRRGVRRLAKEVQRRHDPAQNERRSCHDDQFETIASKTPNSVPHKQQYIGQAVVSEPTEAQCLLCAA